MFHFHRILRNFYVLLVTSDVQGTFPTYTWGVCNSQRKTLCTEYTFNTYLTGAFQEFLVPHSLLQLLYLSCVYGMVCYVTQTNKTNAT